MSVSDRGVHVGGTNGGDVNGGGANGGGANGGGANGGGANGGGANGPYFVEWPVQAPRAGRTPGQFDPKARNGPPADRDYGGERAAAARQRNGRQPPQQVPMLKSLAVELPVTNRRKVLPRIPPKKAEKDSRPEQFSRPTSIRLRKTGPTPAPPQKEPPLAPQPVSVPAPIPSPYFVLPHDPPAHSAPPSPPSPNTGTKGFRYPLNKPQAMIEQPLLRNDEWKKFPEVNVLIGPGLDNSIAIKDIFRAVQPFGTVDMIELLVDSRGKRNGNAKIKFSKVTTPFWEAGQVDYGSGPTPTKLMKPNGTFTVQSRVNPSRHFPEKITFRAKCLEFGFMLQEEEFMAMYKTKRDTTVMWNVNLRRKRVEISFTLRFGKEDVDLAGVPETITDNRKEKYMIEIPFTQLQELLLPSDENETSALRTFVIPLQDPPKVFRILNDWSKSMTETGLLRWTIYDAWMRQTDIEYNMKARDERPVSLRHKMPVIDIGRWTTYRLSFDLNDQDLSLFKLMLDAFRDFNVRSKPLAAFRVNYDTSGLVQIWSHLDQELASTASSSDLLSKPHLSFPVRYQMEVCISHGYLNENNITPEFTDKLVKISQRDAVTLLECVQETKLRFFNPMDVFGIQRPKKYDSTKSIPDFCVHMRRATVTPTGILFHTPSVEISNRVIRYYQRYADRFIRVTFTDEKPCGRIRFTDKLTSNELFSRVYRTLKRGIVIGDRHYEFLAFGNSQLREHGAYFFANTEDLTAAKIRDWMGHFANIRVVAKYASRLGQCFSTTKASTYPFTCSRIPDIERNGYCFTDGVGKMSPLVAVLISMEFITPQRKINPTYRASCFQIRLGGHKGVLVVDPNICNREIQLRNSQNKFWSDHKMLEIIRCSQFASASLNRQLIQVMSALGVSDEFFLSRLRQILNEYSEAIINPTKALELLTKHIDPNMMTLELANLVRGGFMDSQEPFVMSSMRLWRAWTIKYLKEKAKITISDGAFLLGVVDETATLKGWYGEDSEDSEDKLPQIFCQITVIKTGEKKVITGRCIVARNPSLHPGDVRIVQAVDSKPLHHLVDVVVFPQTGDRDIPSMLSGGDLDGDDYVVIWDKELTEPKVMVNDPPALYRPDKPVELTRNVTIQDVTAFFVNYMKNDRLGAIANAHLAWAVKQHDGVKSSICRELAQLHSDAVDYPKTGIKAVMGKKFRIQKWPHFFEKPEEEGVYHSPGILGQLYDMVERVDFIPTYEFPPNKVIMNAFELTEEELTEAKEVKAEYDKAMNRVMAQYDIKTEFEVFSTFVMSHSNANDYKFHEEIGKASSTLKEHFRKEVARGCKDRAAELPRKVAAIYVVTHNEIRDAMLELEQERDRLAPRNKGRPHVLSRREIEKLPLMSFPWVFPEVLVNILQSRPSVLCTSGAVDWVNVESLEIGAEVVAISESSA